MTRRTPPELPRIDGKRYVVTGGAAGMGYFATERLAGLGARVTIAARNAERAERAIAAIRAVHPAAAVDFVRLDLASLASVRAAASGIVDAGPLDGVIANAGVLPWEKAAATEDGFDPVFGTNQLGHFALLAQVFGALTSDAAVVELGSRTYGGKRLDFDDLQGRGRRLGSFERYGRSKLAVMTTAIELDRRIRAAGLGIRAAIAHPGYASGSFGPLRAGISPEPSNAIFRGIVRTFANSKQEGAEIAVAAALVGKGGECWGPVGGLLGLGGPPGLDRLRGPVLDPDAGAALWAASEALTGVEWTVGSAR